MGSVGNPSVNRYLEDKAFDHIDHALGRPIYPLRESHRNYFATGSSGEHAARFESSPFWRKTGQRDDMAFYSVTDAGRKALCDHLASLPKPHHAFVVSFAGYTRIVPERTRAKARYAYYLEISDCDCDLTFRDFSKRCSVRRAA